MTDNITIVPCELSRGSIVIGNTGDMVIMSSGNLLVINDYRVAFSIAADGRITQGWHTQSDIERLRVIGKHFQKMQP